jgi:sec-independent protein translocase protein TatA
MLPSRYPAPGRPVIEEDSLPFEIGPLELVILLVIVLLIVGPKRLPQMGRSLGSSMREFKNGITGHHAQDKTAVEPPKDQAGELITPAKPEDVETKVP